jgi:shikimate kinase/3-dehydroquinate synthase
MSIASTTRGIALGGLMGAGKSTVGRELARRLGLPFVDVDAELERRHGPVPAQFAEVGESGFRERECAYLAGLGPGPRVVATGGGAFVDPTNREVLRVHHALVTLSVSPGVARRRIGSGAGRPLADGDLEELLRRRYPAYADVDLAVEADGPVEQVVADIEAWWTETEDLLSVPLGERAYPVIVRAGLTGLGAALRRVGFDRVVVVTDHHVAEAWGASVRRALLPVEVLGTFAIPPGEASKSVGSYAALADQVIGAGLDRRTGIVAFGGGVVGDLAGFVAATALRGVPWAQVPTSTLAMVDSAIGGKVGVNLEVGKNLLGAFHQPRLVWAPLQTLATLAPRERHAGWAEAVKTAWIAGPEAWERLCVQAEALRDGEPAAVRQTVRMSLATKASIVARDERESGERAWLNLGHTVGHALEAGAGFGALLHGEAVAIGLVAEARLAERIGIARGAAEKLAETLHRVGLSLKAPAIDPEVALRALQVDKKRGGAMFHVPLPVKPGEVRLVALTLSDVATAIPGVR